MVPADGGSQRTLHINANSIMTALAVDRSGFVYWGMSPGPDSIFKEEFDRGTTDGGADRCCSTAGWPTGIAIETSGDMYWTVIYSTGATSWPSGSNEVHDVEGSQCEGFDPPAECSMKYPQGVAADDHSNVFIADTGNNRIVKVPADGGPQTTVGTELQSPLGVAVDRAGNVFVSDKSGVIRISANGSQAHVGTGLNRPEGLAVDAAGNLYIVDVGNSRVVQVPAGGGAQFTVLSGIQGPRLVAIEPWA